MREQIRLLKVVNDNMKSNFSQLIKNYPDVVFSPEAKLLAREMKDIEDIIERMNERVGGNGS